jgi:hypothetical protein
MAEDAHIPEDDAEALRVRRAELHDFMREIAAAALMLPAPETYLEAERAVRAITMADRMAQMLRDKALGKAEEAREEKQDTPPPPKTASRHRPTGLPINGAEREARDPIRKALRMLADRLMAAAKTIPLPCDAITALRALRYARACERILTQLYAAPNPKSVQPVKPAPPAAKRSPEEIRLYYKQIEQELWEKFSPSPEAQALRAAKQLAAQTALETESPEPDASPGSSTEDTKTPTEGTTALNPRPNISEGQAGSSTDQTPDPP